MEKVPVGGGRTHSAVPSAVLSVFNRRLYRPPVPEPVVNLQVVKNDSYEKGNDLMVVNVYMKGICRDTARVFFREQDFTLMFQTRYGARRPPLAGFTWYRSVPMKTTSDPSVLVSLSLPQGCKLSAASSRLRTEHGLQVASQTQVAQQVSAARD